MAAAAAGMPDVQLLVTGHVAHGECQSAADMAAVMQNWQITSTATLHSCYHQYYHSSIQLRSLCCSL